VEETAGEPVDPEATPAGHGGSGARSTGAARAGSGTSGPGRDHAGILRLVVALTALVVGVGAMVVAALVAVAPVEASTSTATWPKAGTTPVSTTLFLAPYRPATLDVTVPCTAIRTALARPDRTTILATGAGSTGLTVRTEDRALRVFASGRAVPVSIPTGDCTLRVAADAAGLRLTVGPPAAPVAAAFAGDPVPEVFAVTTDLTGPQAGGLALRARTPSWFDNAPTPEKSGLVQLQLQLAAVALGLVVILALLVSAGTGPASGGGGGGSFARHRLRAAFSRPQLLTARSRLEDAARREGEWVLAGLRRPRFLALATVDVVVALGSAWWSIIGPTTDDDGFAVVIARRSLDGDVGNYYRWYNASEAPFASGQRILSWFLDEGLGPVTLRLPSVLAGFALWLVVTRGVLRPVLGSLGGSVAVRCLAAVALAVWWLAYNLGTRPEPLVALGATTVLALVLRAVRDAPAAGTRSPQPVALLGLAVLVAGLTATVAPSGLIVAAPFLLYARRVGRVVLGRSASVDPAPDAAAPAPTPVLERWGRFVRPVAHLAVLGGLAAVAVVVVFADQSWHGLLVSTAVHSQIGPSQPWYAEWLRYGYLFGDDSWGNAAKRVPVLLGLVLTPTAGVLLVRGARLGVSTVSTGLLALLPVGLVLLAVTPSKWSHHFGALAGFGAVFLVVVVVALARLVTADRDDPVLHVTGLVTVVAAAFVASFAFSAPMAWWGYSNIGQPGATGPQRPFDSPLLWLVVSAGVVVVLLAVLALRRLRGGSGVVCTALAVLTPGTVTVLVACTSVAVLLSSAATAGDRGDRYSLAGQNRAALVDPSSPTACGLQDRIQVLTTALGGPLVPVAGSTATLEGFVANGGWVDPPPPRPGDADEDTPPTNDSTRTVGSGNASDAGRGATTGDSASVGKTGKADAAAGGGRGDGRFTWGSKADGASAVGDLTSPWFGLPRPGAGQELAASVSGRTSEGASVTWEFARGDTTLGERPVVEAPEPERGYRGYAADAETQRLQDQDRYINRWRTVTVAPTDIPAGTDRVRLLATDDRADDAGWVAVSGPRLVDVTPLTRWLAGRGPVLVDWAIAFAWPCQDDLPRVSSGVAQAPGVIITGPSGPGDPLPNERTTDVGVPGDVVPERWTSGTSGLFTDSDTGGTFAGVNAAATTAEVDTRLTGEPERRWGQVLVPDYGDLERDAYDATVTTSRIDGTAGDPPPVRQPLPASGP